MIIAIDVLKLKTEMLHTAHQTLNGNCKTFGQTFNIFHIAAAVTEVWMWAQEHSVPSHYVCSVPA